MEIKRTYLLAVRDQAFFLADGYAQLCAGCCLPYITLRSALYAAQEQDLQSCAQALRMLPNLRVTYAYPQARVSAYAELLRCALDVYSHAFGVAALVRFDGLQQPSAVRRLLSLARLKNTDLRIAHDPLAPALINALVHAVRLFTPEQTRAAFTFSCDETGYRLSARPSAESKPVQIRLYSEQALEQSASLCSAFEARELDEAQLEQALLALERAH